MKALEVSFGLTVLLLVASVIALAPAASFAEDDPFLGTWVLNVAKSRYEPGPPPKDQTVTYEAAGDGVKITVKGTNADGTPLATSYTGKFDGKDYPTTPATEWDTQSLKRVDARTMKLTRKKSGKVVQTLTNVVSADGKTRTLTMTGVDGEGQKISTIAVYDKK